MNRAIFHLGDTLKENYGEIFNFLCQTLDFKT